MWDPARRRWVTAAGLAPGRRLLAPSGATLPVTAVTRSTTPDQRVYNLTIDHTHTYYVTAGNTPVLVHNSGPCKEVPLDSFDSFEQARNKALALPRSFRTWDPIGF